MTDSPSLSRAAKAVGCENFASQRNRSFLSAKDQSENKLYKGVILFCEQAKERSNRDIAAIYGLSGTIKNARNTYRCPKYQVRVCRDLYQRNQGNRENAIEVTLTH